MALQVHRAESKDSHPLERQMTLLRQTKSGERKYNPISCEVTFAIIALKRHLDSVARNFDAFNPYAPTIDRKEFKDLTEYFIPQTKDMRPYEEIFDLKCELDANIEKFELKTAARLARILTSHFRLFRGGTDKIRDKDGKSLRLNHAQQKMAFQVLDELEQATRIGRFFEGDKLHKLIEKLTIGEPSKLIAKYFNGRHLFDDPKGRELALPLQYSIISYIGSLNIIRDLLQSAPEKGLQLLAQWIDGNQYKLPDLTLLGFNREQIESVAPLIQYADFDNCRNPSFHDIASDRHVALCVKAKTLIVFSVSAGTLSHLEDLERLTITSSSPRAFNKVVCSKLKAFTCYYRDTLPPPEAVPALEELEFRNLLEISIPDRIKYYHGLKRLWIDINPTIAQLPFPDDLPKLAELGCNNITSVPAYPELEVLSFLNCDTPLPTFPKLKVLCILPPLKINKHSRRRADKPRVLVLSDLPELQVLDARKSKIPSWPHLPKLRFLSLSGSDCASLPESSLATLEELNICNTPNLRRYFPKGMINLKKLIVDERFDKANYNMEDLPKNVEVIRLSYVYDYELNDNGFRINEKFKVH